MIFEKFFRKCASVHGRPLFGSGAIARDKGDEFDVSLVFPSTQFRMGG
jgi:hypothetical protein